MKKEFYKRFLYLPIPKQYLDKIWEWIEQQIKDARIDELENLISIIGLGQHVQSNSELITSWLNGLENRRKELKIEKSG